MFSRFATFKEGTKLTYGSVFYFSALKCHDMFGYALGVVEI